MNTAYVTQCLPSCHANASPRLSVAKHCSEQPRVLNRVQYYEVYTVFYVFFGVCLFYRTILCHIARLAVARHGGTPAPAMLTLHYVASRLVLQHWWNWCETLIVPVDSNIGGLLSHVSHITLRHVTPRHENSARYSRLQISMHHNKRKSAAEYGGIHPK